MMTKRPETTAQEAVYVVIGYQGEWSSLEVWVAGVFTNKSHAVVYLLPVSFSVVYSGELKSKSVEDGTYVE